MGHYFPINSRREQTIGVLDCFVEARYPSCELEELYCCNTIWLVYLRLGGKSLSRWESALLCKCLLRRLPNLTGAAAAATTTTNPSGVVSREDTTAFTYSMVRKWPALDKAAHSVVSIDFHFLPPLLSFF